jgi:hypothetical protein
VRQPTTPDPSLRPKPRRFERVREAVDDRERVTQQRLTDARRRALVSVWLRSLSR